MKWVFYIIVFVYMLYRAVYGAKFDYGLSIEPINYDESGFLPVGGHITINCKATTRNQKVEWVDPNGIVIRRGPGKGGIFAQEHYVKGRTPVLALTFSELKVHDSGVYVCRSGDRSKEAGICVIEPSVFVDTPTEVAADLGRSITLTCQAKGLPEPSLQWTLNGQTLTDDDNSSKYRVMTKYNSQGFESLLTIMSLSSADSGIYSCLSQQNTPGLESCSHSKEANITLNVNSPPAFDGDIDEKLVFGNINEQVDLVCAAKGFPTPTYRWFKDDNGLHEIDEKQIIYSKEDNQATLKVTADSTTYGQSFKCRVTNSYGQAERTFTLLPIQAPKPPNEINLYAATDSEIKLNVSWPIDRFFPVDGFQIQRLKVSEIRGKYLEWRKAKLTKVVPEENEDFVLDSRDMLIVLRDLEENTKYWLRVRATNIGGDGPWSAPILLETLTKEADKIESEATSEAPQDNEAEVAADEVIEEANISDGTFYGIFFAGGILVVAAVCMFAMRLV